MFSLLGIVKNVSVFRDSSVVERSTVNRMVPSSNLGLGVNVIDVG